jgi:mannose-6-phosphate isomerase
MSMPTRLAPSFHERVWGRTDLSPFFTSPDGRIGEVWFTSEQDLPLLVKILFTSERLSVQVHPADGEAGPRGKTEMWHILEAEPGAKIAVGFREPMTRTRLLEATAAGEVEALLNWIPVKAGETYLSRAHTVHAIGGGLVICEIQQNSDVTYRLWDYGRQRATHVQQAVAISDLNVYNGRLEPSVIAPGFEELARCEYFVTERVELGAGRSAGYEPQETELWIVLKGCGEIDGAAYRPGEVWHCSEPRPRSELRATTDSELLRTYVPK